MRISLFCITVCSLTLLHYQRSLRLAVCADLRYRELQGDRVYLSDTCVPISNVAVMLAETESDFISAGFPCIICAHIADGNFHACIPYVHSSSLFDAYSTRASRCVIASCCPYSEHALN